MIASKDQAQKSAALIGISIYGLSLFHMVLLFFIFLKPLSLIDSLNYVLLGHAIKNHKSRMASIILIVTAVFILSGTLFLSEFVNPLGISKLALGVMLLIISLRAYDACQHWHSYSKSRINVENVTIKTSLAFAYGIVLSRIVIFIFSIFVNLEEINTLEQNLYEILELSSWSLGAFITFHGWAPFTQNKPLINNARDI